MMKLLLYLTRTQELSVSGAAEHFHYDFPGTVLSTHPDFDHNQVTVILEQVRLTDEQRDWLHLSSMARYIDRYTTDPPEITGWGDLVPA